MSGPMSETESVVPNLGQTSGRSVSESFGCLVTPFAVVKFVNPTTSFPARFASPIAQKT